MALLGGLLETGDKAAVMALFEKLMLAYHKQEQQLIARRDSGKSEGVSAAQLALAFSQIAQVEAIASNIDGALKTASNDDGSEEGKKASTPTSPPRRRQKSSAANLPVVENPILVASEERACPSCGKERGCIGHDITEIIDIEPARAIIRRDMREKLGCKSCDGQIVRAPLGDKVVEGGLYGSRLVADMVVSKYSDGLPLERQRERYARLGLDMPSATMGDQIAWAAELLAPIARRLLDQALDADVLHLDATSLPVLDRDAPTGIKTGSLWGYVGLNIREKNGARAEEPHAVYLYTRTGKKNGQSKEERGPEEILALRRNRKKPFVVADAAGLFDMSFALPGLTEVGCHMHARRYFAKAFDAGDQRAALPLGAYKKIYDIEEDVRDAPLADRQVARTERVAPVYRELLNWCEFYSKNEPPSSLLAKAVNYTLNHRVALSEFLSNAILPADNGVVERLHRRPAMGRRAYLFAGSDVGAQRAAVVYSVLGTCRLLEGNPTDYLGDVLPKLARGISIAHDLDALMPAAWFAAR